MARRFWWVIGLIAVFLGGLGVPAAFAQGGSDDPAQLAAGQTVFEASCAGCHGTDGMGSQTGRSLIGIAQSEPDRSVHIGSVTNGKGNMPAFATRLSEDEIDAAVSYVRLTFVDPAAQTAPADPAELAVTGTTTLPLAGLGVLLLAGGLVIVALARQRRSVAGTALD